MPTPVIYQNGDIDPFAHLDPVHKSNTLNVFYATNRVPEVDQSIKQTNIYTNSLDSKLHLGTAMVQMGTPNLEWKEFLQQQFDDKSNSPIPVYLESIREQAAIELKNTTANMLTPQQSEYFEAINRELAQAADKEILVYVHGTKVDFTNSALLTAEIDHFAGRDFVGVAFAWPSHQNIFYYLTGVDVRRAVHSVSALKKLLYLLAQHTTAESINLLAYSAGGKIATQALYELRQELAGINRRASRNKLRLGSVIFAAIDVELDVFLERLPSISEIADQVVVTVTDLDNALIAARRFMGGKNRVGAKDAEADEESFIIQNHLSNVEIIDVSYGQEVRGFNINGHHYWYRHPWVSSDIIFLLRTDLPPERRGLAETELESIWYLSQDYPEKIKQAANNELRGQW